MTGVVRARAAYLLLLDGVSTALATREDVDLTYLQTLDANYTAVKHGLQIPRTLVDSLDLVTGLLADTSATFKIEDTGGTLAALFKSSKASADELLAELTPGATALSTEWGKQVGPEMIGPAGERRRCSCIPGWNIGLHHYSSAQSHAFGLGATLVSDSPIEWAGRRVALYRLVQASDGSWPDLTDAAAAAAARCWWGTLLGQGSPDSRVWSLRCAGRESWAMGTIGIGSPKEPFPVQALTVLDLDKGETLMRASLWLVDLHDPNDILFQYVDGMEDTALLDGLSSYADVAAAVDTFLAAVAADGAPAFTDAGASMLGFSVVPGNDGVWIRWNREEDANWAGGDTYVAYLNLELGEKAWKLLGYEPSVQNSERNPVENEDQYGQFYQAASGHWVGKFYSANAEAMLAYEKIDLTFNNATQADFVNGQQARRWPPIYPSGCQVLDMDISGQEVQLITLDPVFMIGSNAVPLIAELDDPTTAYSLGGGAVTHTGIMAFRGPFRREGDEDQAKPPAGYAFGIEREREEGRTTQVALVCWRAAADGSVAVVGDYPTIVIHQWLEPRLYGIGYDQLTGKWASWRDAPENGVETTARPLIVLEHGRTGDSMPLVIAMLLASTGTAGSWYSDTGHGTAQFGLGGHPDLEVGANDLALDGIGDEGLGRWTDALPAQLGRAIPAVLISDTAERQASFTQAIAEYAASSLFRCKVVADGPLSVKKLLAELLGPTGLCMSLAGGRYGLFDPWTFRPAANTGNVTSESYAGKLGDPRSVVPKQTLRKFSAIDRLELQATRDVVLGTYARTTSLIATDPGVHQRHQTNTRPITGTFLVHPASTHKGANWGTEFAQRWDRGFGWWAQQHFDVEFKVPAAIAGEFEVGSIISLTDSWVVSPVGVYGVSSAPGFVISRSLDCAGEVATVTAIVSADALIKFGPAAQLDRYDDDEDGEGYRLFCRDDMFGCRNGASFDVDGFAEPAGSTAGGDALIEGWAFDGVTWSRGIFGVVDSVDTSAPGSTFIKLTGALTGETLLRDHWHVFVLRNEADQTAAWVPQVFAPICDKDGTSDGSLGKRWQG